MDVRELSPKAQPRGFEPKINQYGHFISAVDMILFN
jgi:hypothetical protein